MLNLECETDINKKVNDRISNNNILEIAVANPETFEIKILTSGLQNVTLPCHFLVKNGVGYLKYDTSGHIPLNGYPFEHMDQVLHQLYLIVTKVSEAEDFLLLPEGFLLSADRIFISHKTGAPRLIYSSDTKQRTDFIKSFVELTECIKSLYPLPGLPEALGRIQDRVHRENPDIHSLALIINSARGEMNRAFTV
jgi:hypothetical protein